MDRETLLLLTGCKFLSKNDFNWLFLYEHANSSVIVFCGHRFRSSFFKACFVGDAKMLFIKWIIEGSICLKKLV